ncbi:hypothetical protein [Pseudovibrio sp. SPO723]|uniref:hypothetical protein n=1 Tax=Nesiotobacter zosterae TaxID=392721 RepID=UPI0029C1A92E|nr:hypothetical protein [Pseudovibrio sp. SPO723]MDX5595398.1 hypothetical protein [Pseudovibrio sp. SPO723]
MGQRAEKIPETHQQTVFTSLGKEALAAQEKMIAYQQQHEETVDDYRRLTEDMKESLSAFVNTQSDCTEGSIPRTIKKSEKEPSHLGAGLKGRWF